MPLSYIVVAAFIAGVLAIEFAPEEHHGSPEDQTRFGMYVGGAFIIVALCLNGFLVAIR